MRDFWDAIAQAFGYDYWAWGSAADWVAGVGTIGTLVFSLVLLTREINEKRRQMADGLLMQSRVVRFPFEDRWATMIEIQNTGTHSIYDGYVFRKAEVGTEVLSLIGKRDGGLYAEMKPRESQRIPIDSVDDPRGIGLFIEYKDGRNRVWYRSVLTDEYMSERKVNRLYWGHWFGQLDKAKIRERALEKSRAQAKRRGRRSK